MKKILFISITFLISCGLEDKVYYYDFDKITHYSINIGESEFFEIVGKNSKSKKEQLLINILLNETPTTIRDTLFLNKLNDIGFVEKTISKGRYENIKEIFCEKTHFKNEATSCIAVYRDILVFKKNSKIVGIAKICFECGKDYMVGTNANTSEFGQSGDYEKLYELLNQK
jgi:hypothetical protein